MTQQTCPAMDHANHHHPGCPKIMCWCSQATMFQSCGDGNQPPLWYWTPPPMGDVAARAMDQPFPPAERRQKSDSVPLPPPLSLWCSTSPLFVWRTSLCKDSQWKRILSRWKAKNKGWPVSPAAKASRARASRKIKVWVMRGRTRRVGINSFLSLHSLWYFYNILCIPEFFFLIYHPNKHPWETLTGSCPEGRRFKKRLFPGLLNLTGKCVIVSSDCSLSLGKTQQCPKHGV